MTCSPDDALAASINLVEAEAAGVLRICVIRQADVPDLLAAVRRGDIDAMRTCRAILGAQDQIAAAPKHKPMRCASCPRPLRKAKFSFVVVLPDCAEQTDGPGLAVCTGCATETKTIELKAAEALKNIWPNARPFFIRHPGGRA
jgi:hypothetical protein